MCIYIFLEKHHILGILHKACCQGRMHELKNSLHTVCRYTLSDHFIRYSISFNEQVYLICQSCGSNSQTEKVHFC